MRSFRSAIHAIAAPAVVLAVFFTSAPADANSLSLPKSIYAIPLDYMEGDPSSSDGIGEPLVEVGQEPEAVMKLSGSNFDISCTGMNGNAVNDPHYSKGPRGAIYKTTIQCQGWGREAVPVRVKGYLSFSRASSWNEPAGTFYRRATSDQVQWIKVNSTAVTYYTPQVLGESGGTGKGYWRATSTWYFDVEGRLSTVGSQTKTIFSDIAPR